MGMENTNDKAARIAELLKIARSPKNVAKRNKAKHSAALREEQNERHEVRVLARYGLL